jgi:hypothetical protein
MARTCSEAECSCVRRTAWQRTIIDHSLSFGLVGANMFVGTAKVFSAFLERVAGLHGTSKDGERDSGKSELHDNVRKADEKKVGVRERANADADQGKGSTEKAVEDFMAPWLVVLYSAVLRSEIGTGARYGRGCAGRKQDQVQRPVVVRHGDDALARAIRDHCALTWEAGHPRARPCGASASICLLI